MSVDGTTLDVSRHGVFVETAKPPRERFLLRVALNLPDGPLEANAFVVRRVGPEAGGAGGVGLQFFAMGSDARDRWDRFVGALSGAAQPGGHDAPVASFVVKLGDEDKLREFVARAQASGSVYMVTPLVRPVGTAAAVILVHPKTHRELMLGGAVARVRLEAPKGIEIRLTPMTPLEAEALENFVDGARWDGLTPLPKEWIDDGTPPPDDALAASPMAFDLGSLGVDIPEPTSIAPEQQFAWSQIDAGAVLDVDLSDVDADGGLTDVLRGLGVRVTSTPGESALPEFTIDAGDELVALPTSQPPSEVPGVSRASGISGSSGGWAYDGTPLPSVGPWGAGAATPAPHPMIDAWSRLAPPLEPAGFASQTPSLDIPLTEPTEVTAESLAMELAQEDARAQGGSLGADGYGRLAAGSAAWAPAPARAPSWPGAGTGAGSGAATPAGERPGEATTRDVGLESAQARPELVLRSGSVDLGAPREPGLVRSSLPRPASVDLPMGPAAGSSDLRGHARGSSSGVVIPAARRTANLPRLGEGSDDLGRVAARGVGSGAVGSGVGDPITRDMQASRTGSIPSARRVSVDREDARERRALRSSAPPAPGAAPSRAPGTGDVRAPELALRARIPASPTPVDGDEARLASLRRASSQIAPSESRPQRVSAEAGRTESGPRTPGESIDIELDDDLDALARAAFDAIPGALGQEEAVGLATASAVALETAAPAWNRQTQSAPAPHAEEPARAAPARQTQSAPAPYAEEPARAAPDAEAPARAAPDAEAPARAAPDAEEPARAAPDAEEPARAAPDVEEPARAAPDEGVPREGDALPQPMGRPVAPSARATDGDGAASGEDAGLEPSTSLLDGPPAAVPIERWADTLPLGALEPASTVELACLQCDHTSRLLVGQPIGARGVFSRYRTYECRTCRGFVSVVRPSATADRLRLRDALRGSPDVRIAPDALVELVTAMAELALPAHCPTCGGVLRSTKSSREVERALPRVRAEATLALSGTPCPRCQGATLALGDSTLRPVDPPRAETAERPSWDRGDADEPEPPDEG